MIATEQEAALRVLAVSVPTAAEMTGVSEPTIWRSIRSGDLKSRRLGTRRLILVSDLEDYLKGLPGSPAA